LIDYWESLRDNQRINLLRNSPFWKDLLTKQSINKFYGAPIRPSPAVWKHRGVMKCNHAAGNYKWVPVVPIPLNTFFRVVSIQKEEVNLMPPANDGVEAEFFDPNDRSVSAIFDYSVSRSFRSIDGTHPAEMERVDQPKCSAGRHCLAEFCGGAPLCDANFDQVGLSGCPLLQGFVFRGSVLSPDGPDAEPSEEGMTQ
jgi:hypothetical protein